MLNSQIVENILIKTRSLVNMSVRISDNRGI